MKRATYGGDTRKLGWKVSKSGKEGRSVVDEPETLTTLSSELCPMSGVARRFDWALS